MRAQVQDVRRFVMSGVMRLTGPAFVKQELAWVTGVDVQIVKKATILFARRREEIGQCLFQFRFFSRESLEDHGHDDRFHGVFF